MKEKLLVVATILGLSFAGFFLLNSYIYNEKQADLSAFVYGEYGYRCGDGTEFTMHPNKDLSMIRLVPATSVERIPETIISRTDSETGARYEGNGIVFHAHGESVELSTEAFQTSCLPMQVPAEAPFNFGD